MPVATKIIRSRIKSVKNTRKITKAMELVAASKMRKATEAAVTSRPYSEAAETILREIGGHGGARKHPLLRKPTAVKNELLIVVTSDKGLCGGLNANIIRAALDYKKTQEARGISIKIATVGKKGRAPLAKNGAELIADFTNITDVIDFLKIRQVGMLAMEEFNARRVDQVSILYTHFQSALVQKPILKNVLPLTLKEEGPKLHDTKLFEPSAVIVYREMLPRFLEGEVYHAILEAVASEHSARMLAMRNASDAADEITDDLTLTYNQARQAGITQEIAEIAGGAAALG